MTELTVKIAIKDDSYDNRNTIGDGDASSPNWEKYLQGWNEGFHLHLELLKKWVFQQNVIPCSDEICNNYYFKFSDGESVGFSWRAWGNFTQAVDHSKPSDDEPLGYMRYFTRGHNDSFDVPDWTPNPEDILEKK